MHNGVIRLAEIRREQMLGDRNDLFLLQVGVRATVDAIQK